MSNANPLHYYSLSVPWIPSGRTEWHPTEPAGPFATLSRGAFATVADALAWGAAKLGGAPYVLVLHTPAGSEKLLTGEAMAAAIAAEPAAAEALAVALAAAEAPTAPAPEAPAAPAPEAPALDFAKLSPRAVADARGFRRRSGRRPPSERVIGNHFSMSGQAGHLGVIPPARAAEAFTAYARIFRAVCGDDAAARAVPEAELPRTHYRIRVGGGWLASLVCEPGGAKLTDDKDAAGLFDGPVRLNANDYHGPGTTVGLARRLLNVGDAKAWCEPADGGPGFWAY